jgi:hypothetical protein
MFLVDSCLLHVTSLQPLQITPALQEAHLWTLLWLKTLIFVYISDFWGLVLSELYGYSAQLTTFLGNSRVRFGGQSWYFNPQWTAGRAINKASRASNSITHWNNCAVAMCHHMNQDIWRGLGGEGGSSLATQRNPDLQDSCSYQNTAVFQVGVNKIRHTICDVFRSCSAIKRAYCTKSLEVIQH